MVPRVGRQHCFGSARISALRGTTGNLCRTSLAGSICHPRLYRKRGGTSRIIISDQCAPATPLLSLAAPNERPDYGKSSFRLPVVARGPIGPLNHPRLYHTLTSRLLSTVRGR